MKVHISFDDVKLMFDGHASFITKASAALFMAYLRYLHKKFGAKFTVYVFGKSVKDSANKIEYIYYNHFRCKEYWIKFGYHAWDLNDNGTIEDIKCAYSILCEKLSNSCMAEYVRLHKFEGTREMLEALTLQGVKYMLCSDGSGISYDLSKDESERVRNGETLTKNNIYYINTDIRLENITFLKKTLNQLTKDKKELTVFSHEWCFCFRRWKDIIKIGDKIHCWVNLYTLCKCCTKQNYSYIN